MMAILKLNNKYVNKNMKPCLVVLPCFSHRCIVV